MSFALFFLGEYANMILMSAMTTILFLGGWLPPFGIAPFTWIPGPIWFILKICFCAVRASSGCARLPALPLRPADAAGLEGVPAVLAAVAGADAGVLVLFGWLPERLTARAARRSLTDGVPRSHRAQPAAERAGRRHGADAALLLQAEGDDQLPVREGPDQPALQGRARAAPLSRTARSAASPASCARRSARRRRSPSRPSRATTARAAPRATTST